MSVCVTSPGKFTYENRSNFSVPVSADRTQQPKGGIQTVMKSQKERQDRERERERENRSGCLSNRAWSDEECIGRNVSVVWDSDENSAWKRLVSNVTNCWSFPMLLTSVSRISESLVATRFIGRAAGYRFSSESFGGLRPILGKRRNYVCGRWSMFGGIRSFLHARSILVRIESWASERDTKMFRQVWTHARLRVFSPPFRVTRVSLRSWIGE